MKLSFSLLSLCVALVAAGPSSAADKAATAPTAANMQIFMDKVRADKKLIVSQNMKLTEAEAKAFWPVYDAYQKELAVLNDRLLKAIVGYANAYNAGPIPDDLAKKLTSESIAIDEAKVQMRKTNAANVLKVLPATKAARYLQVENKIRAALDYELAAQIPLAE